MTVTDGWITKTLSEVANITMGQSPDSKFYSEDEVGMPFLQGCAEFGSNSPSPKLNCTQIKKVGKAGSLLFSVRAPVGKTNKADRDYIIGRGLAAIQASSIDSAYLEQFIEFAEPQFRNASQGSTFEAINSKELSSWPIEFPYYPQEQTKIATILSTLDCAIEQTEAIIAKQRRIKAGLMQDLLTKGIDENGVIRSEVTHKFKDSPLGRIPVEWEIEPLGKVASLVTSGSRGWARFYSTEGAVFLRIGNLTREHINFRFDDVMYVNVPESSEGKRTAVQEGDLLISITADLGIIAVVPEGFPEAYVNQHIALVRLNKYEVFPRFIGHLLNSGVGQTQIEKLNESGAKAGLNLPTIENLRVFRPTYSEQQKIVDILDGVDSQITIDKKRVDKLRRQKAGLMHDLLTGTVRVN